MIAEETPEGILLRPAVTVALELYSAERKAEFLLSNAVDEEDYAQARQEAVELGVDPDSISRPGPETC